MLLAMLMTTAVAADKPDKPGKHPPHPPHPVHPHATPVPTPHAAPRLVATPMPTPYPSSTPPVLTLPDTAQGD